MKISEAINILNKLKDKYGEDELVAMAVHDKDTFDEWLRSYGYTPNQENYATMVDNVEGYMQYGDALEAVFRDMSENWSNYELFGRKI